MGTRRRNAVTIAHLRLDWNASGLADSRGSYLVWIVVDGALPGRKFSAEVHKVIIDALIVF